MHKYSTSLSWGGDVPTAELEVTVSYTVAWGSPERGMSGPPENYDPGCASVVEDIKVLAVDGRPVEEFLARQAFPNQALIAILDKLEDHEEAMLEAAEPD